MMLTTRELLAERPTLQALTLEKTHGNADLIKLLEILGIAGPFARLSAWELQDEKGQHLINAGGYAALPFGEAYAPLVEFLQSFLAQFSGMGLPQQSASLWRGALAHNLVKLLAKHATSHTDSQVFFSNSGAEAVETALKLVRANRPKAPLVINFARAYHGKTMGALSLTPNEEYQAIFRPLLGHILTLPYGDSQALTGAIKQNQRRVAAVIVEPVQGEGGVITPPADFLPTIQELAERYGFLTVADEIQTGLGRCGDDFASVAGGLTPDIITLAKPLGGGLVPIGATIARKAIMNKMLGGLESKRHSNTFGGGTLAMAVGVKSLEILQEEKLTARAKVLGERGLVKLRDLQARYPGFFEAVRGHGMLFALQLRPVAPPLGFDPELISQLGSALGLRSLHLNGVHGCYTLNSSRTVRLTPALNMPEDIFTEMFARVEKTAQTPQKQQLLHTPPGILMKLAQLAL